MPTANTVEAASSPLNNLFLSTISLVHCAYETSSDTYHLISKEDNESLEVPMDYVGT